MENQHLNARMLTQDQVQFLDQVSSWLRVRWDQEHRYMFRWDGLNAADEIDEMTAKSRGWHVRGVPKAQEVQVSAPSIVGRIHIEL